MPNDEFIRDLLSTLSHDIRGALGGADSLNQIISDGERSKLDAKTQKRLSLIHKEYVYTNCQLKALSDYARLFNHNEQLETCCLHTIANDALSTLITNSAAMEQTVAKDQTTAIDQNGFINQIDAVEQKTFSEIIDIHGLPSVVGFASLWRQYFTELFANSIQHARPTGGSLKARLSARLLERSSDHSSDHPANKERVEQNTWDIIYEDNGAALSEKELSYIARPFKTLSAKTGSVLRAGLGIARLARIMELHNGSLALNASEDTEYSGLRVVGTFVSNTAK